MNTSSVTTTSGITNFSCRYRPQRVESAESDPEFMKQHMGAWPSSTSKHYLIRDDDDADDEAGVIQVDSRKLNALEQRL